MSVLIREDSRENERKKKLEGKRKKKKKKHSVHVTTFITSFIYMYVHGDRDQPGLKKREMSLDCEQRRRRGHGCGKRFQTPDVIGLIFLRNPRSRDCVRPEGWNLHELSEAIGC